jgi:ribosome-associated protein|tara:strand:- start:2 stop:361 length:360 start_codon:yes stop_codon:yes gene_type:complete
LAKQSLVPNSSAALVEQIAGHALEKKAEGIISLDVNELTSLTDFFLICSADTEPQIKAICDNIRKGTYSKPWHIEGYEKLHWVLIDYIDVVVHVFRTTEREYYSLEKLWADAPRREFTD